MGSHLDFSGTLRQTFCFVSHHCFPQLLSGSSVGLPHIHHYFTNLRILLWITTLSDQSLLMKNHVVAEIYAMCKYFISILLNSSLTSIYLSFLILCEIVFESLFFLDLVKVILQISFDFMRVTFHFYSLIIVLLAMCVL